MDFFIYVIDVAAGDKIPRKNGPGIAQSDILVINKMDLAPYVDADLDVMRHDAKRMRDGKPFLFTNCKTGEGIDELIRLIRENVLFDVPFKLSRRHDFDSQRTELAPYLDEPKQLPSGSFGKCGCLRLRFERRRRRSDSGRQLSQSAVDRAARSIATRKCPGCLTFPSSLTQAASCRGTVMKSASRWLPTPRRTSPLRQLPRFTRWMPITRRSGRKFCRRGGVLRVFARRHDSASPYAICHTHAAGDRPTATLFYAEVLAAGRKYYREGELYRYDLFSSLVHAERPDGRELFTEKLLIEPARKSLRQTGVMGRFDVFANVLVLTPRHHASAILDHTPAFFQAGEPWAAGASRLPNDAGLIYKIVGMETQHVRQKVREFWSLCRREIVGVPAPRPFAWS